MDDSLNPQCSCSVGTQQCPADAFYPPVKEKKVSTVSLIDITKIKTALTATSDLWYKWHIFIESQISSGDILIDLTSRNVSQWLLKTRPEFFKRRYGGFEFGVRSPLADLDVDYLQDIFSTLDKATNLGESRLNFLEKEILFGRIGLDKNIIATFITLHKTIFRNRAKELWEKQFWQCPSLVQ